MADLAGFIMGTLRMTKSEIQEMMVSIGRDLGLSFEVITEGIR
jgi:hypothetical protein